MGRPKRWPMTNTDDLLEHARRSFRNASECSDLKNMRTFADMGIVYLRLAHESAAVLDLSQQPHPSAVSPNND
jgi:hypothetical protein